MITTLLHIYLAGWLASSGIMGYKCIKEGGNHFMSADVCVAVSIPAGALWPASAFIYTKEAIQRMQP